MLSPARRTAQQSPLMTGTITLTNAAVNDAAWCAELRARMPGTVRLTHFRYVASHSCTVLYQSSLFCGFKIQCPSSG